MSNKAKTQTHEQYPNWIEPKKENWYRYIDSRTVVVSALGGAAVGSVISGGLGAFIGGLIGALLGTFDRK